MIYSPLIKTNSDQSKIVFENSFLKAVDSLVSSSLETLNITERELLDACRHGFLVTEKFNKSLSRFNKPKILERVESLLINRKGIEINPTVVRSFSSIANLQKRGQGQQFVEEKELIVELLSLLSLQAQLEEQIEEINNSAIKVFPQFFPVEETTIELDTLKAIAQQIKNCSYPRSRKVEMFIDDLLEHFEPKGGA